MVENDKTFCLKCWKKIKFITKPYCKICSEPFEHSFFIGNDDLICGACMHKKLYFDKAIACFIYNKTIAKSIYEFKFFKKLFLRFFFTNFIEISVKDVIDEVDFIIPVPMDIKRLRWRGYNQSLLLAKELGKRKNKIVINDLLIKTKYTTPQVEVRSRHKRKHNLKSVFYLNSKYKDLIINKNIAIIDDVITTGTTTNECAKVLKQNNTGKVFVFAIAKTSLKKKDFIDFEFMN